MSLKNAPDAAPSPPISSAARPSPSLATRLTAWYAGFAFLLVFIATGFLYWVMVKNIDAEDDQTLGDKVRVLSAVLRKHPGDTVAIHQEIEGGWEFRQSPVYVRVIGTKSTPLIETPGMDRVLPAASFPPPAVEPAEGMDFRSAHGRSFRILTVRVLDDLTGRSLGVIQAGMDRTQEIELLAEYRKNLWGVLGAVLLVCAIVGYHIARRGLRPLHVVTDTARRIDPSNLGERIESDGLPVELLALAGTFNQMLDRLELSFTRLSQFSADIAHELRTPVNNLRGEIEVALSTVRAPGEYRDVLGSNLEECGRLSRMIDSLLFLARAENPRTQIVRDNIDISVELETICEFYEAAASERGVKLTVTAPQGIHVYLNRSLFQRAVGNLVANALAHTPREGAVTLAAWSDDTSTVVAVQDTGCGIPADHLPHVFDRFYRADQVRSSSTGNVGLGLSIVKSIVELHSGSIQITSELGRGTHVAMHFPHRIAII